MILALWIIFVCYACKNVRTKNRAKAERGAAKARARVMAVTSPVYITPQYKAPTPAEIRRAEKEKEQRRKAEEDKRQAQLDLEFYEQQRTELFTLCDLIQAERDDPNTTPKRKTVLQRQLITAQEKLHRIDQKRNMAYFIATREA